MPRLPDPQRKPELIAEILDYLLDKPLSGLTFRTLAKALDVSTFTLVYQFGTRAELLSDIVWAISSHESDFQQQLTSDPGTIDIYFEGFERSWQWVLQPRNRQLQRLEFEAGMVEALDPDSHTFVRAVHATWQRTGADALRKFGVGDEDAEIESRVILDTFYGLQFDLVLNGDEEKATAAFNRALSHHRGRVLSLIGQSA